MFDYVQLDITDGRRGWPQDHDIAILYKSYGKNLNIQYWTKEKENTAKLTNHLPKTFMAYFTNPIIESNID